jgi:hypothetical protein
VIETLDSETEPFDDGLLCIGDVVDSAEGDRVRTQQWTSSAQAGESRMGTLHVEQVRHTHPVENPVTSCRCVQVGVSVDVDQSDVRSVCDSTSDHPEFDRAVAAEFEHRIPLGKGRVHLPCQRGSDLRHLSDVAGGGVVRVIAPAHRGPARAVPDHSPPTEDAKQAVSAERRGGKFLARAVRAGTGRRVDHGEPE